MVSSTQRQCWQSACSPSRGTMMAKDWQRYDARLSKCRSRALLSPNRCSRVKESCGRVESRPWFRPRSGSTDVHVRVKSEHKNGKRSAAMQCEWLESYTFAFCMSRKAAGCTWGRRRAIIAPCDVKMMMVGREPKWSLESRRTSTGGHVEMFSSTADTI